MTLSSITYCELQKFLVESSIIEEREAVLGITIDGKTSKDLDDAIWIEPYQSGAIVLIHISDVTALIPEKSQLEHKALRQIETCYLASSTNPLFPNELSENKLSLLCSRILIQAHSDSFVNGIYLSLVLVFKRLHE